MKKMRSVIELVDVMKVSDEESTLLTEAKSYEQAADQLLAMGPKLVAITLGEQGVLMATKSRKEIIKAFQTHAVDTTGAGDSFWGGVLCSILSMNKNIEKNRMGRVLEREMPKHPILICSLLRCLRTLLLSWPSMQIQRFQIHRKNGWMSSICFPFIRFCHSL